MQTFNEISATLAKISSSSTQAIAGPVADVILAHAQSKERLNQNFLLLGAAWEKIFNGLMADFSLCLDNKLQAALSSVKNEAEIAMNGIIAGSNQLKRRRVSISPEPDRQEERRLKADTNYYASHYDEYGSSGHAHSSMKRSKLTGRSRSSSPDPRQKDVTHNKTSVVKISLDDILNQMKMKIDQQSSSLQSLSKENEEVTGISCLYTRYSFSISTIAEKPATASLFSSSRSEIATFGTLFPYREYSRRDFDQSEELFLCPVSLRFHIGIFLVYRQPIIIAFSENDTRRHSSSGHRHHSRTDSKR